MHAKLQRFRVLWGLSVHVFICGTSECCVLILLHVGTLLPPVECGYLQSIIGIVVKRLREAAFSSEPVCTFHTMAVYSLFLLERQC